MLVKILKMHSLEDAPWTWKSNWNKGMPEFFQDMPSGVTDNIYEDLDDSPVTWKINEVRAISCLATFTRLCSSKITRVMMIVMHNA
jgi:hypothetical protein